MSYLIHYGVKGQKWGVRRYEKEDGTLTELGKSRNRAIRTARTKEKVDSIYNSLSKKEKYFLGTSPNDKEWLSLDEGERVVKRFIKEVGNKPVAFLDILGNYDRHTNKTEYLIGIATRSGRKYRGKGYAKELGKKAIKWIDSHPKILDQEVLWIADPDNTPSNNLAKNLGFKFDEAKSANEYDNIYKHERKG